MNTMKRKAQAPTDGSSFYEPTAADKPVSLSDFFGSMFGDLKEVGKKIASPMRGDGKPVANKGAAVAFRAQRPMPGTMVMPKRPVESTNLPDISAPRQPNVTGMNRLDPRAMSLLLQELIARNGPNPSRPRTQLQNLLEQMSGSS